MSISELHPVPSSPMLLGCLIAFASCLWLPGRLAAHDDDGPGFSVRGEGGIFIRGDSNQDGQLDISDAIFGLEHLSSERLGHRPEVEAESCCGDIQDDDFVFDCIRRFRPDRIYHLAGLSSELGTWTATRTLYATNILGTLNLLAAAATAETPPRVLVSSSSAVYATPGPDALPLKETASVRPRNHYGATKLAQEAMCHVYYHRHALPVVLVRAFNIIGPGQSSLFVTSSLARQIVEAELGLAPPHIAVGNLEPQRDYVDVRDAVRAFWLAMEKGQPGEIYNVCSGRPSTVREILEALLKHSTLVPQDVHIDRQVQRIRMGDEVLFHYGDSTKLAQATGWRPATALEQTLIDLLMDWRHRLQQAA